MADIKTQTELQKSFFLMFCAPANCSTYMWPKIYGKEETGTKGSITSSWLSDYSWETNNKQNLEIEAFFLPRL